MTTTAPDLNELDYRLRVAGEVRAWMGRRRLNQRQLCAATGFHTVWLSRRMTGVHPFSVDDLLRLAWALDCDLGDLLPEHELHRKPVPTSLAETFGRNEGRPERTGLREVVRHQGLEPRTRCLVARFRAWVPESRDQFELVA